MARCARLTCWPASPRTRCRTATATEAWSPSSRPRSPGCSASRPPSTCPAARWPSSRYCACTPTAASAGRWCTTPCATWTGTTTGPCRGCTAPAAPQAVQRLHGLTGRPAGDQARLLTVDDLTAIAEPPGTLLIELPQRDLGGQQPDWDELRAATGGAPERGAAVHLDRARVFVS